MFAVQTHSFTRYRKLTVAILFWRSNIKPNLLLLLKKRVLKTFHNAVSCIT